MSNLAEKEELKSAMGFGKSPRRRSVYVNRQYDDCLWYFWNGAKNAHDPIESSDLFCLIQSLAIKESEFKGKPVEKVEINVQGDEKYRLLAGIDTVFCKSVVSNLLYCDFNFAEPVSIFVKPGDEEGVVFGRVYQDGILTSAESPQLKTAEDVKAAIVVISDRLAGKIASVSTATSEPSTPTVAITAVAPTPKKGAPIDDNLTRLSALRKLTGHTQAQAKAIAASMGLQTKDAKNWSEVGMNNFCYALMADWGMSQNVFGHLKHSVNALNLLTFKAESDTELWDLWVEDVGRRKSELLEDLDVEDTHGEVDGENILDENGNPF